MLRWLLVLAIVMSVPSATALPAPCAWSDAPIAASCAVRAADEPLHAAAGAWVGTASPVACAAAQVGAATLPVCAAVVRGRGTCVVLLAGDRPASATCIA